VRDGTGATLAGVVLDPVRDEAFAATHDGPATLGGRTVTASACDDLAQALVATGFGYDTLVRDAQAGALARLLPAVRDIRRAGSAALDLAWAAAGRLDAYFERGVHVWDVAAGLLIAERAGLARRDLPEDGEHTPAGVLVAPPAIADGLLAIVG
jgi:myo-inositol-1(or 4)-monophosphatase